MIKLKDKSIYLDWYGISFMDYVTITKEVNEYDLSRNKMDIIRQVIAENWIMR